ncbi:MAG: 16S rRNA (guanine(527)-N(7))-methyltransferase RsmG, partial [Thermodesulfovibrionales bacterium]
YNLTSIRKDDDIIIKHFLDSLLYLKALPEGKIAVMDIGSGAGFPGIPLKIIRPEIRLFLVEPSRKKAGFLMHIVKTLRLEDVEVIEKRIEDVSGLKVDVALTRALFDIGDFYKRACHLLKEGGRLILSKGPRFEEETKEIKGNLNFEILKLRLPLKDIYRYIVIVYPQVEPDKTTLKVSGSSEQRGAKGSKDANICFNIDCRLRKAGCKGFEGCPGFKTRA